MSAVQFGWFHMTIFALYRICLGDSKVAGLWSHGSNSVFKSAAIFEASSVFQDRSANSAPKEAEIKKIKKQINN